MAWPTVVLRQLLAFTLLAASALPASADGEGIYWGAHIPGVPSTPGLIDGLEARAGKHAAIIGWGQPWFHAGAYKPFETTELELVRQHGSIPALDWGSWDYCCDVTQPQFRLSTIINGAHDDFLRQWAKAAAAWGHPFFLRFDPEMNGWWNPWSEQVNDNHPGEFVRAWRHVVDIFREQGAANVTWVWCPNIVGPRSTPMAELYPGDDYVDWACLDGYNFGLDHGNAWLWFYEVFTDTWFNAGFNSYELVQQAAPGKPLMIGETASSENGGSKSAWITDMLQTQLPQTFRNVDAFIWFDWNGGDPTTSWEIGSSPSAQTAFRTGLASPLYIGNEFASLSGPILPRRSILPPPSDTVQPAPTDQTAASQPILAPAASAADEEDSGGP